MKKMKCIIFMGMFIVFVMSCRADNTDDFSLVRLNGNDDVDIWSSIQYEELTDINAIRKLEAEAANGTFMFHYLIRLENRGSEPAQGFQANYREATPLSYIIGSGGQGIGRGELKPEDIYELHAYYLFDSKEKMEDFIERSNLLLEWTENEDNKKMILKFPEEPTQ